jgi:DNA repair photolyase
VVRYLNCRTDLKACLETLLMMDGLRTHGCIYCFARPTHSYLNLSPGLDFETQLIVKYNIADVLRKELEAKQYQPQRLNIGSATDAYQPIEREG